MPVATRAGALRAQQSPNGAASYAQAARTPAPPTSSAGAEEGAAGSEPSRTPATAEFSIIRPQRPEDPHSTSSSTSSKNFLQQLVKSLKNKDFSGEGSDVQELLNAYKEKIETAVIIVEPPDEFTKLITLDDIDEDDIDAYSNQKLYAFLHSTTIKSANRTVRQFASTKNGHLAWKALHQEFLPQDALSRTALQTKISTFAIKPHLDPKPQLDELMRIIDTYERVRGVPLQDVDIQDAVIGALSRADTNMFNELVHSLNKDTLTSQKISISQVRNMAGSAFRTHKEQNQLKNNPLKQPREKALAFVEKKPEKKPFQQNREQRGEHREQRGAEQREQRNGEQRRQHRGGNQRRKSDSVTCFICRQTQHGDAHHRASECPLLKHIPKGGNHPHKANVVKSEDKDILETKSSSSEDDTESINTTLKRMGLSYCVATPMSESAPSSPPDIVDWIIDSGSTVHITCDPSILFNYDKSGAKTVEVANGQLAKTDGCGEVAFHARDIRGKIQLVRIANVHLVRGKLNLLDVDRLLEEGFENPDFSTRRLTRGSITWPLRPNTRPATWRVRPIRASPSALATNPASTQGGILDIPVYNVKFPAPSVRGESALVNTILIKHTEDSKDQPAAAADLIEPTTYRQAQLSTQSEQWQSAMDAELASLKDPYQRHSLAGLCNYANPVYTNKDLYEFFKKAEDDFNIDPKNKSFFVIVPHWPNSDWWHFTRHFRVIKVYPKGSLIFTCPAAGVYDINNQRRKHIDLRYHHIRD